MRIKQRFRRTLLFLGAGAILLFFARGLLERVASPGEGVLSPSNGAQSERNARNETAGLRKAAAWAIRSDGEFWRADTSDAPGAQSRHQSPHETDLSSLMERAGNAFRVDDAGDWFARSYTHRAVLTDAGVRFHPFQPGYEQARTHRRDAGEGPSLPDHPTFDPKLRFDWALTDLRLNGRSLDSASDWEIRGNTAQRKLETASGEVIEHLQSRDDGVERTWVIPSRPAAGASLEVDTRVAGLEYGTTTDTGTHFVDASGAARLRVSHPVLVDARGQRRALEARRSANGLRYAVAAADFEGLEFPVALDPQLSAEFAVDTPIAPTIERRSPALDPYSWDDGAFVAWDDARSGDPKVFVARVDDSLSSPDGLGIDVAVGERPRIACEESTCVVFYARSNNVWLREYDFTTGEFAGPELRVSDARVTPLAWEVIRTSQGWLVAWSQEVCPGADAPPADGECPEGWTQTLVAQPYVDGTLGSLETVVDTEFSGRFALAGHTLHSHGVATWRTDSQIVATVLDSAGQRIAGFEAVNEPDDFDLVDVSDPDIAMNEDGDVLVAWGEQLWRQGDRQSIKVTSKPFSLHPSERSSELVPDQQGGRIEDTHELDAIEIGAPYRDVRVAASEDGWRATARVLESRYSFRGLARRQALPTTVQGGPTELACTSLSCMAAWHDTNDGGQTDLAFLRLDSLGAPVGEPIPVIASEGPGNQHTSRIARGPDRSLITWTDDRTGVNEVYGVIVTHETEPQVIGDGAFLISAGETTGHDAVFWQSWQAPDEVHFLVAIGKPETVEAVAVSFDGAVGVANVVAHGPEHPYPHPRLIAARTTYWLNQVFAPIVWSTSAVDGELHYATVDSMGVALTPEVTSQLRLGFPGTDYFDVAASSSAQDEFSLAYSDGETVKVVSYYFDLFYGDRTPNYVNEIPIDVGVASTPVFLFELGTEKMVSWSESTGEVMFASYIGRRSDAVSSGREVGGGRAVGLEFAAGDGASALVGFGGDAANDSLLGTVVYAGNQCGVAETVVAGSVDRHAPLRSAATALGVGLYLVTYDRFDSALGKHRLYYRTFDETVAPPTTSTCACAPIPEVVNDGLDQDCDGYDACYQDLDGDTYGTEILVNAVSGSCDDPANQVSSRLGDCDDSDAARPGVEELGNGVDEDCDGQITCFLDADMDGFGDLFGLQYLDASQHSSCDHPSLQASSNRDDCPGLPEPSRYPGAPELCDAIDNDCDDRTDEDFPLLREQCLVGLGECRRPSHYECSADGLSLVCNEDPLIPAYPGNPLPGEDCDLKDNDCDGQVDESCYGACGAYGLQDKIPEAGDTTLPSCVDPALNAPELYAGLDSALPPMEASYGVSSSGLPTFSYDVPVYPGRGDMAPSVALSYSPGASGEVGRNMTLTGFSSIARCNKSVHYDDGQLGVDEALCLDGARLKPWATNTCNEMDPSQAFGFARELRPVEDSRTKVCEIENGGGYAVFSASGHVMLYGASPAAREYDEFDLDSWLLERVVDRFGNGREYTYTQASSERVSHPGRLFPAQIVYTSHFPDRLAQTPSEAGLRSVVFHYENTGTPWAAAFVEGQTRAYDQRLEAIEVKGPQGAASNPELTRRTVVLRYSTTDEPMVESIELHASDFSTIAGGHSTRRASPIRLEYSAPLNFQVGSSGEEPVLTEGFTSAQADFDGDGFPEFFSVGNPPDSERHTLEIRELVVDSDPATTAPRFDLRSSHVFNDAKAVEVIDINGDGKADVLTCERTTPSTAHRLLRRVGTGSGFGAYNVIGDCDTFGGTGDFNGDGLTDMILHNSSNSFVLFAHPTSIVLVPLPSNEKTTSVGDWDGDGADDILYLNGDNARCVTDTSGSIGCSTVSADPGKWPTDLAPAIPGKSIERFIASADVNSDGIQDLISWNFGPPPQFIGSPSEFERKVYLRTKNDPSADFVLLFEETSLAPHAYGGLTELDGDSDVELIWTSFDMAQAAGGEIYEPRKRMRIHDVDVAGCIAGGPCETFGTKFVGHGSLFIADVFGSPALDVIVGFRFYEGGGSDPIIGAGPALTAVRDGWNTLDPSAPPSIEYTYQSGFKVFEQESSVCSGDAFCAQPLREFVTQTETDAGPNVERYARSYQYKNGVILPGLGFIGPLEVVDRDSYGSARLRRYSSEVDTRGRLLETLTMTEDGAGTRYYSQSETDYGVTPSSADHRFVFDDITTSRSGVLSGSLSGSFTLTPHRESRTDTDVNAQGHVAWAQTRDRLLPAALGALSSSDVDARLALELAGRVLTRAYDYSVYTSTRAQFEGWANETVITTRTSWCESSKTGSLNGGTLPIDVSAGSCGSGGELTEDIDLVRDETTGAVRVTKVMEDAIDESLPSTTTVVRDAYGNVTLSTLTAWNGMTSEDRVTEVGFDATEHMFATWTRDPEGHITTASYWQATGTPLTATDANGLMTLYERDVLGSVVKTTYPTGEWELGVLAATGTTPTVMLSTATTGSGGVSVSDFDRLGREFASRASTAFGTVVVEQEWDALGRATRASIPRYDGTAHLGWNTVNYDGMDRVQSSTTRGVTTHYRYEGLIGSAMTDGNGEVTSSYTGANGELVARRDAIRTVTRHYNAANDSIAQIEVDPEAEAAKKTVATVYDAHGRVLQLWSPDRGARESSYNGFGEVIWVGDARGETQSIYRDHLGREVERLHVAADGTERRSIQVWDTAAGAGIGQPAVSRSFDGHEHVFNYTDTGLLASVQQLLAPDTEPWEPPSERPWEDLTFSYTYDEFGRLQDTVYPQVQTAEVRVTHHYSNGQLLSVSRDGATLWSLDDMDADGHVTAESHGNGTWIARTFDPTTGWLESQVATHAGTEVYREEIPSLTGRDGVGNITRMSRSRGDTSLSGSRRDVTFGYDSLYRLTTVSDTDSDPSTTGTMSVSYDAWGNIRSKTGISSYDYSGRTFSPSRINGQALHYDGNGNVWKNEHSGTEIVYDEVNRPASMTTGGTTTQFEYGPDGTAVLESSASKLIVRFMDWELEAPTPEHSTVDNTIQSLSIGGGSNPIGQLTFQVTRDNAAFVVAESTRYFVRDHLGTLAVSMSDDGSVALQQEYDAFGKRTWTSSGELLSTQGAGYTGHHDLDAHGLVSMRARLFDPSTGRFINPDPIVQSPSFSQNSNRYTYAYNNPLRYIDPTGMANQGAADADEQPEVITVRGRRWGNSPGGGGGSTPSMNVGGLGGENFSGMARVWNSSLAAKASDRARQRKQNQESQERCTANPSLCKPLAELGDGFKIEVGKENVTIEILEAGQIQSAIAQIIVELLSDSSETHSGTSPSGQLYRLQLAEGVSWGDLSAKQRRSAISLDNYILELEYAVRLDPSSPLKVWRSIILRSIDYFYTNERLARVVVDGGQRFLDETLALADASIERRGASLTTTGSGRITFYGPVQGDFPVKPNGGTFITQHNVGDLLAHEFGHIFRVPDSNSLRLRDPGRFAFENERLADQFFRDVVRARGWLP